MKDIKSKNNFENDLDSVIIEMLKEPENVTDKLQKEIYENCILDDTELSSNISSEKGDSKLIYNVKKKKIKIVVTFIIITVLIAVSIFLYIKIFMNKSADSIDKFISITSDIDNI